MEKRVRLSMAAAICLLLLLWFWSRSDRPPEPAAPPASAEAHPAEDDPPRRQVRRATPEPEEGTAALEEGTDEAEEDTDEWTVRCPIALDAPFDGEVTFVEIRPFQGGVWPREVPARIDAGLLKIVAENPENSGFLKIPGYPDLKWEPGEGGACPSVSLEVVSAVVGTVTPAWGRVRVSACGSSRDADGTGSFYIPASPGLCRVRAYRIEPGGIQVEGDSVEVEIVEGQDAVVDLTVPDEEWGTIGMSMQRVEGEDAVWVTRVIAGSAAEAAGIQVDDRVVSIGGESPVDCDRGWLFNCLHGPLDSTVQLEFADGETLELERSPLPEQE